MNVPHYMVKLKETAYLSFLLNGKRVISRTLCSLPNEDEGSLKKKSKERKMVVLKKIFPSDPNKPLQIVEAQDASKVLRKYNWENKHLFGPVQSAKRQPIKQDIMDESNLIIQHETQYPIVEPQIKLESDLNSKATSKGSNLSKKFIRNFDYNMILTFPLINKVSCSENINTEINELNCLRKYLEAKSADKIPSVSAILDKTKSKESAEALERWKQSMIESLGEEGFEKYQTEMLKIGSDLHTIINSYLAATPETDLQIEKNIIGHWQSLKPVIRDVSNVKLLEEKVSHPFLCYRGVVDCFAKYRGHLVVIDWKTSKKMKSKISSTFDNPLQIAAYVGALNFDPKFQYLVSKGLIVVAYENGSPATAHLMEEAKLLHYWKEWLKRVKQFWEKQNSEN